MQVLFDLIHSLTKEEKRLYHLHGKGGRLSHIYDAYHRAGTYGKQIDQVVYKEHFQDVTRAFYSMQKRALLDDLLFVLLQFSNSGHPAYQFLRAFSRGMILLQRQMGEGAFEQLEEAAIIADQAGFRPQQRTTLVFQAEALVMCEKPSFETFNRISGQLDLIKAEMEHRNNARKVMNALTLLYHNYDEQDLITRIEQARGYMDQVADFDLADVQPSHLRTIVKILRSRLMYAEITGTIEDNHKHLLEYYQKYAVNYQEVPLFRYEVLGLLLRSALRAGDFLNLQGMLYKVNKEIEKLPADISAAFLPGYLEVAALYHFYEKDLTTALQLMQQLLAIKDLDHELLNRCIYYRLAMLVAASLPRQAISEVEQYQKRMPGILHNPILWVLKVVLALEDHAEGGEILLMIERIKIQLRKMKDIRKYQDNLYLIEALIERKKARLKDSHLFPPQWEPILRIDLLLLAKKQNNFYYNLLTQAWESRKKVY